MNMNIYLAFNHYIHLDDIADQDDAIPIVPIIEPDESLLEIFKTEAIFETSERDTDKLLRFMKRNLRNEQSCCEIFVAAEDFKVKERRFINLHSESTIEIKSGDYIGLGYFFSNDTQFIDKSYQLGKDKVYVIALERINEKFYIHLCCEYTCKEYSEAHTQVHTRREKMKRRLNLEDYSPGSNMPNKVIIHNQTIELDRQSVCYFSNQVQDSYGRLLYGYLKQLGHIPCELIEKNMAFVDCTSDKAVEKEILPAKSLRVGFGETHKDTFIGKPFLAGMEKQSTKICYNNSESGKQLFFYSQGLRLIDVLDGVEDQKLIEQFEKLCPREKRLLALAYVNPYPEYSLMFYTKEFLDSTIKYDKQGQSIGWLCRSDEVDEQGFPIRLAAFYPVDKDFNDNMELELFSIIQRQLPHADIEVF